MTKLIYRYLSASTWPFGTLLCDQAPSFFDLDRCIGLYLQLLHATAGPLDLHLRLPRPVNPKEQPAVVIRHVAGAGTDVLRLSEPLIFGFDLDLHPRAQRIPVAPISGQGETNPISIAPGTIVTHQNRRLVVAGDEDICVTVIIVVPEGGAAPHLTTREEVTTLIGDVSESPVVVKDLAGLSIASRILHLIRLIEYVTIDDKEILPAIQV